MPDQKLPKKKTSPLFYLLLVVVLLGAGYYYYLNFLSTPAVLPEVSAPLPITTTGNWEKDVYQNPSYTKLVNPLSGKVEPGVVGNPKPFVQITPEAARK